MNSVSDSPAESDAVLKTWIHRTLLALFVISTACCAARVSEQFTILNQSSWTELLLLLAATFAVLSSVSRTISFQYALWGALMIGTIGGMAHAIGTLALIPFGPFVYTRAAGPRIFGVLPWIIPLIWIVFIFSSRGVARLILRRWRWTPYYGFWLIGLTALLSLVLNLSFDPWASGRQHYWIWELTRFPYAWQGTPLTNFAGWFVTSAVAVAFVTPMLINKKPGATSPRELGTLLIWLSLNLLFIAAR